MWVAKRPYAAAPAVAAAGWRDAQWWLGCAHARIKQRTAWARLLALGALARCVVGRLAPRLVVQGDTQARPWRRRVVSRRRGRCALRLVSAMSSLRHQAPELQDHRAPRSKLKRDGDLAKVS